MAKVTLSQAAKDNHVSLPTLSRWRKSGKISAEKTGSGSYRIDTSEYDRIIDLKKQSPNMKRFVKHDMKGIATPDETPNEMRVLRVEVEVLRERVKDKDQIIDDLREDRDDWKKQARTLLLQSTSSEIAPNTHTGNKEENQGSTPAGTTNLVIKERNMAVYSAIFLATLLVVMMAVFVWMTHADEKTPPPNKNQQVQKPAPQTTEPHREFKTPSGLIPFFDKSIPYGRSLPN